MDRRAVCAAVLLLAAVCILAACAEKMQANKSSERKDSVEDGDNVQARIRVTLQDEDGSALSGGELRAEKGAGEQNWIADESGILEIYGWEENKVMEIRLFNASGTELGEAALQLLTSLVTDAAVLEDNHIRICAAEGAGYVEVIFRPDGTGGILCRLKLDGGWEQ